MNQISFFPHHTPALQRTYKAWCEGCGIITSTNNSDRAGAICIDCMKTGTAQTLFLEKMDLINNHQDQLVNIMCYANNTLTIKDASVIAFKIYEFLKK